MKLPATALAETQDKILSRTDYTPDEAHNYLDELDRYKPFLATQPWSNLQIRQWLLIKGLLHIIGIPISTTVEVDLSPLVSNGRWVEGHSYWIYTLAAISWLNRVTEGNHYANTVASMTDTYMSLVAPDGTVPLPECRDEKWFPPQPMADYVSTPAYICKRWSSGAYLLVAIDPEMPVRGNLHAHPECGYFAFGQPEDHVTGYGNALFATRWETTRKFEWKVRCRPYEGFDFHNIIGDDGLLAMLPPGAVLPTWRIKPPRITVKRLMQGVEIRWDNHGWFDSKRTITWGDGKVVVTDRWSGFKRRVRQWSVA